MSVRSRCTDPGVDARGQGLGTTPQRFERLVDLGTQSSRPGCCAMRQFGKEYLQQLRIVSLPIEGGFQLDERGLEERA